MHRRRGPSGAMRPFVFRLIGRSIHNPGRLSGLGAHTPPPYAAAHNKGIRHAVGLLTPSMLSGCRGGPDTFSSALRSLRLGSRPRRSAVIPVALLSFYTQVAVFQKDGSPVWSPVRAARRINWTQVLAFSIFYSIKFESMCMLMLWIYFQAV